MFTLESKKTKSFTSVMEKAEVWAQKSVPKALCLHASVKVCAEAQQIHMQARTFSAKLGLIKVLQHPGLKFLNHASKLKHCALD